VTGPAQKAERINIQMLEQADNLSEDEMLPKQIRETAHEVFKDIGWWTNAVFYRAIAVEGIVWWYNASKRYQGAPDGASESVIFQGCCKMLSMVQSTIKLAKSLNPNLTSGKRLHSNGVADLLDTEDEGAATSDGFDARSQYGIGNIKVDSAKRYALVFASALRFLNNLARVHGEPLPVPSSLNVLSEQELASHIVKVVAALEWPTVPGAAGIGPLAQAVAALCLRDNRSLMTVQQGAMPNFPSELGLCEPRQLEATCSAVMYCLKAVMLWYGVLVPESASLLFDASRSGGILAKIKGLFNHMPPTATRQQRYMFSQELSQARNGSAVCLVSSPNSTPYAIGVHEVSGAYGSAVQQATNLLCDLLRECEFPEETVDTVSELSSALFLTFRPNFQDVGKFALAALQGLCHWTIGSTLVTISAEQSVGTARNEVAHPKRHETQMEWSQNFWSWRRLYCSLFISVAVRLAELVTFVFFRAANQSKECAVQQL
jgi:hypothetical protein